MRLEFQAVVDELKRLRRSGVEHIYLDDSTLRLLRELSQSNTVRSSESSGEAKTPPNLEEESEEYSTSSFPEPPMITLPQGNRSEQWIYLKDLVVNCTVCRSHVKAGKKVVFGVGDTEADLFFCGEAPGADEETQGEPFVGKAGQLLTRIINAMGLKRTGVYIANIMNWRPETSSGFGNRPPTQEEMHFCLPYLRAQLSIVNPKVIVALGSTAVSGLLGPDPDRRMGSVRGKWYQYEGVPLLVTYHPSYVLRNGSNEIKRLIWSDMLQVMEKAGQDISEEQRGYFQQRK